MYMEIFEYALIQKLKNSQLHHSGCFLPSTVGHLLTAPCVW